MITIPYLCLKTLQKVVRKLVVELEKKLKIQVLFVAKRAIQSKWIKIHKSQKRPRSRTLTAVHDALLEDLILPGSIISRRIRCRTDGSKFYKM